MEKDLALAMLIAKERSGELPALRNMVRNLAAPFHWYDSTSEAAERIVNNGTACFVNTGQRELMITCDHVYSAWMTQRAANPNLICQVGGAVLEPSDHLIDRDETLDLATFEIGSATRAMALVDIHTPRSWPPSIHSTDIVMAGGFPGLGREEFGTQPVRQAQFLFPTYAKRVDNVRDDNIGFRLATEEAFSTQGLVPRGSPDLGGASGGPVVRLNPDTDLMPFELVGIIYEYQASYELLFARPLSMIRADGRLVRAST